MVAIAAQWLYTSRLNLPDIKERLIDFLDTKAEHYRIYT